MDESRLEFHKTARAGSEFTKGFYELMDKNRGMLSATYSANATLCWNGNIVEGSQGIQNFLTQLPDSEHRLTSIDVHPIIVEGAAKSGLLVSVSGTVKFQDRQPMHFAQSFVLLPRPADQIYTICNENFRFLKAM